MRTFTIVGTPQSSYMEWFIKGVQSQFERNGYVFNAEADPNVNLVFNLADLEKPRPYRRQSKGTFVVSVIELEDSPEQGEPLFKAAYPYLVRTLSNHLICITHDEQGSKINFITPEQGCYCLINRPGTDQDQFFELIFKRLEPLASSNLIIDNIFDPDLPESLWEGDHNTEQMYWAGKKLDEMNLLPAPFPIEEYVTERDLRHIHRLYGLGGLSYGNLSCRRDEKTFWMSASGVNKANLKIIGQDILLIKDYDQEANAMRISVPPHIQPKRASVDAIEHWMIYREHPEVGAIVHVHAWMDGVKATEINYPCGTIELAKTVAQLVRESEDPSQAVIGLKNHGLTITGRDLENIFERIEGRIIPRVPME